VHFRHAPLQGRHQMVLRRSRHRKSVRLQALLG
jgi:hypothetical protein